MVKDFLIPSFPWWNTNLEQCKKHGVKILRPLGLIAIHYMSVYRTSMDASPFLLKCPMVSGGEMLFGALYLHYDRFDSQGIHDFLFLRSISSSAHSFQFSLVKMSMLQVQVLFARSSRSMEIKWTNCRRIGGFLKRLKIDMLNHSSLHKPCSFHRRQRNHKRNQSAQTSQAPSLR